MRHSDAARRWIATGRSLIASESRSRRKAYFIFLPKGKTWQQDSKQHNNSFGLRHPVLLLDRAKQGPEIGTAEYRLSDTGNVAARMRTKGMGLAGRPREVSVMYRVAELLLAKVWIF